MNKSEIYGEWQEQLLIYKGILFNNQTFENDYQADLLYDFDCAEYKILENTYSLSEIAGIGTEFEKATRLVAYFAPKLTHKGDYDNHIECNALSLLEYSLNKPEQGINCVTKAKILQECCLALGIYARRIWLMPYSPYDGDCHVVNEIFDSTLHKWIMLDLTTNGYFVDAHKTPLSVLEMREKFANDLACDFIKLSTDCSEDFENLEAEQLYTNKYFAKNLFYIVAEKENCFGDNKLRLTFLPIGFHDMNRQNMNYNFRLKSVENARKLKIITNDEAVQLKEILNAQYSDTCCERSCSCNIQSLIKRPT